MGLTPAEVVGLRADDLWDTPHPGPDPEILQTGFQLVTRRVHRTGEWLYLSCRMLASDDFVTEARPVVGRDSAATPS